LNFLSRIAAGESHSEALRDVFDISPATLEAVFRDVVLADYRHERHTFFLGRSWGEYRSNPQIVSRRAPFGIRPIRPATLEEVQRRLALLRQAQPAALACFERRFPELE